MRATMTRCDPDLPLPNAPAVLRGVRTSTTCTSGSLRRFCSSKSSPAKGWTPGTGLVEIRNCPLRELSRLSPSAEPPRLRVALSPDDLPADVLLSCYSLYIGI